MMHGAEIVRAVASSGAGGGLHRAHRVERLAGAAEDVLSVSPRGIRGGASEGRAVGSSRRHSTTR